MSPRQSASTRHDGLHGTGTARRVVVVGSGHQHAELRACVAGRTEEPRVAHQQQSHVKPSGVVETFDVHELLDDVLEVSAASWAHDAIEIVRRFEALPPVTLDRHKMLQILMNLLANARDAVMTNNPGDRRIIVSVRNAASGNLEIAVDDNGCGVDAQHVDQIFGLGFTTKRDGRGLGLHYSACAAGELRGNLTVHSDGIGSGAAFVLVLPLATAVAA
jgi:signal transduction histidine kinase